MNQYIKNPKAIKNRLNRNINARKQNKSFITVLMMLFVLSSYACSENSDMVESTQKLSSHDSNQDEKLQSENRKKSENFKSATVKIIRAQEDIERDKLKANIKAQTEQKPLVNPKDVELAMMMQLSMDKGKAQQTEQ